MRIDTHRAAIRIYDHEDEYEAKRRFLQQYGETFEVHNKSMLTDGVMVLVPQRDLDGIIKAFEEKWPDSHA